MGKAEKFNNKSQQVRLGGRGSAHGGDKGKQGAQESQTCTPQTAQQVVLGLCSQKTETTTLVAGMTTKQRFLQNGTN